MKSRTGKIARLPCSIRDELNGRLESAEPGSKILAWLNGLPGVKEILDAEFGGDPVTKQNLSHWRQNGYRDWLGRQDLRAGLRDAPEFPADGEEGWDLNLIDNVATVMAARLGALLTNWDGEVTRKFGEKARSLNDLCLSVVRLQNEINRSGGEKRHITKHCIASGSGAVQGSPKQSKHQKTGSHTVHPVCRPESTAKAGNIQVSESPYERGKEIHQFEKTHDSGNPPVLAAGFGLPPPLFSVSKG